METSVFLLNKEYFSLNSNHIPVVSHRRLCFSISYERMRGNPFDSVLLLFFDTMLIAMTTFPNDGRKLKQLIQGLIRPGIASCIQRINYVKSYYMQEGQLKKEEEKILIIKFPKENKEQLTSFLKKNHPYQIPELVFLAPEEVDKVYLERVQSQARKPSKK